MLPIIFGCIFRQILTMLPGWHGRGIGWVYRLRCLRMMIGTRWGCGRVLRRRLLSCLLSCVLLRVSGRATVSACRLMSSGLMGGGIRLRVARWALVRVSLVGCVYLVGAFVALRSYFTAGRIRARRLAVLVLRFRFGCVGRWCHDRRGLVRGGRVRACHGLAIGRGVGVSCWGVGCRVVGGVSWVSAWTGCPVSV